MCINWHKSVRKLLIILLFALIGCAEQKPAVSQKCSVHIGKMQNGLKQLTFGPRHLSMEVHWQPFTKQTLSDSFRANRFMVLYIYGKSCKACELMNLTSFSNPAVINLLNSNFTPIKIDGDEREDVSVALVGNRIYPSLVILAPNGTRIGAISGYMTPDSLEDLLFSMASIIKKNEAQ